MPRYLELNPDQLSELLADIQKKSRAMYKHGSAIPYVQSVHLKSTTDVMTKLEWLSNQGDVI